MGKASLLSFVSLLALSTGALAQTEPPKSGAIEEVVVTAQRRSERLQDVPISASVLSSKDLVVAGAVDTTSLANAVPGLTTNTNASSFLPRIRGVGSSALSPSNENPVALYVDDVYYGSQLMTIINTDDVAQVAVLKGPQGTLFGRNATGGVIQLTTREPVSDFGGELRTDLDNYLTSRNYVYLTGGLTEKVRANLSVGYTTQGDGWGTNTVTGKDTYKIQHDLSLRSKVVFELGPDTTVKLNLDYNNRIDTFGPNTVPYPGATQILPFTFTSNIHDYSSQLDNRNKVDHGGGSLKISQSLGFAELVSISSYRHYNYKSQFDLSMSPVSVQQQFLTVKGRQISQEVQLLSQENKKFNWIIGFYYYSARDQVPPDTANQINRIPQTAPFLEEDFPDWSTNTNESKSGYAQATVLVLPETNLTMGIRYTIDERTQTGQKFATFVVPPFFPFCTPSVPVVTVCSFPPGPPTYSSAEFGGWTWRVALDHKFSRDLMVYASYNRGFKSGGFDGYSPGSDPYSPEKVDAYELGMKSQFLNGRLQVNSSLFYNEYKNIQVQTFSFGSPVIYNAGSAETYGMDLDFQAILAEGLSLSGGFEILKSKFTKFDSADYYVYGTVFGVPQYLLVHQSATGNRLPYAPEFSGNIGFNYTKEYSFGTLDFDVREAFNSGYFGEANNQSRQPAYNWVNLSMSWSPPQSGLNISFYARNLLDEGVATALYGYSYRGLSAQYGAPPRTFGGRVTYSF